jgi:ankyrin repeat protein
MASRRKASVFGKEAIMARAGNKVAPSNLTAITASPILYAMHLISVRDLLKQTRFRPHQELLREGTLVTWKESMRGRTIFASHQWAAYAEPDPDGVQLRALQDTLTRLMDGKTDVENDWKMQLVSKEKGLVSGAEWAEMVPEMYVWIDYLSMAQPSAGCMPWEDGKVSSALGGTEEEQKTEDHRHGSGDAVQCLNDGVESLPGYVELSDLILVLVPPTEHKDRAGEACDFASWRGRGWCRLEFMAAVLSPSKNRVLIVREGDAPVEFIQTIDALQLPPGHGEFSCCACDHDFGHGPVPCDRVKILKVLRLLLDGKIAALFEEGDLFRARYFAAMEHWWFRGLLGEGTDVGEEGSEKGGKGSFMSLGKKLSSQQASASGSGVTDRLAGLKAVLKWRGDEEEKKETKKTGMGLLWWAVVADDLPAVMQLLKGGSAKSNKVEVNRGLKEERQDLSWWRKMTPVMMVMCFSRFEIVEALLEAGANPKARDRKGYDAVHLASKLGRADNVAAWLGRFPRWDLERRDSVVGMTALNVAIVFGPRKIDTVRVLLDAGANIRARAHAGSTVLNIAVANLDLGTEDVLALILERAPELLNDPSRPTTFKWKTITWAARVVARRGSKSKIMLRIAEWKGTTPLHSAASQSNLIAMRMLCDTTGIDLGARNAMGHTALDR